MNNEINNNKYSVLMPLYKKDNVDWFKYSIGSILNQTVKPDEIVIVCDGPLNTELDFELEHLKKRNFDIVNIYRLNRNIGLGLALNKGINLCKNEYIARMDADDYAISERCERQLELFLKNPDLDVVGSNVEEFIDNIDNVVSHVHLPETHNDIVKYAKRRCPIRHPALMYKKSAVLKAGNYKDYRHAQDYNLIVNMILSKSKIYNIQDTLVYMRVSPEFYKRRGGIEQAKIVIRLKKEFYKKGFYSFQDFLISGIGNAIVALLPNGVRKIFYEKILRK